MKTFLFLTMTATLVAPLALKAALAQNPLLKVPAPTVRVTGRALAINGTTQIPRGLFGVHATPLDEATAREWGVELSRLIHHNPPQSPTPPGNRPDVPANVELVMDCFWDRYQPARVLLDRQWESNLQKLARAYGEAAKKSTRPTMVEFWNEPYLNWANNPAVNYDGNFYEQANRAVGENMTIKGQTQPTEHLVWDEPHLVAIDPDNGQIDYLASRYIPAKIEERKPQAGDTFVFRGAKTYRLELRPWGRDVTQTSHYSASQNSIYYRQMFLPFGKALKESNPDVQLIGGWGCHLQYDNWNGWHLLYKPLLDDAHQWLDGLNEHHYGGDTRMVAGAYETVAAYAKATYGKDLKFYNTEAGGWLDPEQPGNAARPKFDANGYDDLDATMTYTLRDILHLLAVCPDKAVTRASHMAHKNGDRFALQLLKELRGELLETESSSSNIWTVAARNGSTLVVAFWNDSRQEQTLPLCVVPPPGWNFYSATRREAVRSGDTIEIEEKPFAVNWKSESTPITIGARRAVVLKFDLIEIVRPARASRTAQTQFYASNILQKVRPGQEQEFLISLPPDALNKSSTARLRFIVEGNAKGLSCRINGQPIPVQVSSSYTNEVDIPLSQLREKNVVVFGCEDGRDGFQIDAASMILSAVEEL